MTLYREGDIVSLEAEVRFNQSTEYETVYLSLGYPSVGVPPKKISLVAPHLDEGDKVKHANGNYGTVIAIKERHVWVVDTIGSHHVWSAECVRRVIQVGDHDPEPVNENLSESDVDHLTELVNEQIGASA